jgi:succinate dehydrogenase/fumarate reductase flavoprotein subunit
VLDLVMTEARDAFGVDSPASSPTNSPGDLHRKFQGKARLPVASKIYKTTSNAHTTGDGVGIIWRKGLPLEDMEFYHSSSPHLRPAGLGILLSAARGGARGPARHGREVLHGAVVHSPDPEGFGSPRDIVSRGR